jgi:ornithine carbamoyltransferase
MQHYLVPSAKPWSLDALPVEERQRVIEAAAALARAAQAGQPLHPLRGKNLAVLCEQADCPGFEHFSRAALALGARVSHIRPSEALTPSGHRPDAVGSLLGRLYDAIDCHGLGPEVVDQLARATGKPVFNQLGCRDGLPALASAADEFTLQALLLSALASQ